MPKYSQTEGTWIPKNPVSLHLDQICSLACAPVWHEIGGYLEVLRPGPASKLEQSDKGCACLKCVLLQSNKVMFMKFYEYVYKVLF